MSVKSKLGLIVMATYAALGLGPAGSPTPSARRRQHPNPHRRSYIPHCGIRARARRVGGEAWQEFRDIDRARRGLLAY